MKRCVLVFAAVISIAAIGLAHAESTTATGNELRLEELWISVTDLDEAASFYSEHLGWRVVTQEPDALGVASALDLEHPRLLQLHQPRVRQVDRD